MTDDDYITLIGGEWADPIADIASAWLARINKPGYPTHLTLRDKGSCKAIMLLLAIMLESYSLKAATSKIYDNDATKPVRHDVREWWKQSGYIDVEDVLDVFVIRDALAHNHLYSYSLDWESDKDPDYSHINGGDNLFRSRVIDGKLKHTGLACNPEIICPKDVIGVAKFTRSALKYLSENYSGIGEMDFNFARRGKCKSLWEGIDAAVNDAIRLIDANESAAQNI